MLEHGLSYHHFGLAVRRPSKASAFLKDLGYRVGEVVEDPEQNVRLIWAEHPRMPAVELIFPLNAPGPLDSILESRTEMIYHLCFATRDMEASLKSLSAAHRLVEVSPAKQAVLFGGEKVSFHMVAGFGLIEIVEVSE